MKEIEIKILEINVEEIRKKLISLGARKIFDGKIEAHKFDFENRTLNKSGKLLRLRKVLDDKEKTELCFKDKEEHPKLKIREETEVTTNNFENTRLILEKIGLKEISRYKKHRESYKLKNIRFEIDTFPSIPPFLEIEAQTSEELIDMVKRLGYKIKDMTKLSGGEVIKFYQKKTVRKH